MKFITAMLVNRSNWANQRQTITARHSLTQIQSLTKMILSYITRLSSKYLSDIQVYLANLRSIRSKI